MQFPNLSYNWDFFAYGTNFLKPVSIYNNSEKEVNLSHSVWNAALGDNWRLFSPGLPDSGPGVAAVIMPGFSAAQNFKMVTWNTWAPSSF